MPLTFRNALKPQFARSVKIKVNYFCGSTDLVRHRATIKIIGPLFQAIVFFDPNARGLNDLHRLGFIIYIDR